MNFTYHAPTRTECSVCEKLREDGEDDLPIIDPHSGKASSANNFKIHNWYNFVLGYSPEFPEFMLSKEKIGRNDLVVDPFMGSGTTLVACKLLGIPSAGVDANDFMAFAGSVKLNWNRNLDKINEDKVELIKIIEEETSNFNWDDKNDQGQQLSFFNMGKDRFKDYVAYAEKNRPDMLVKKYMSDKPFVKAHIIQTAIEKVVSIENKDLFKLALSSILVPISNVSYGPGFGIKKPKDDVDVVTIFINKINRIIEDLSSLSEEQIKTPSSVTLGDSRNLSEYFENDSVSLMITSPPYPGDHEYTKHTRLELIFGGMANDIKEFREIKKRMIRGSTTNIYKGDDDRQHVQKFKSIEHVTSQIEERLIADNATSGFEKLYTKLVWEYFGGMYMNLAECYKILKPGGKIALLVSDSHAFKMVHIQTAKILQEIGLDIGFSSSEIHLWQLKSSTSHKYDLREEILILQK